MSDKITLVYFNGRGLGETIRLALTYLNMKYEEVNLTNREEFVKLVEDGDLAYNQVPLLKIDGMKLVQSKAILRYIAEKGGILGQDPQERARVHMAAEGGNDFFREAFIAAGFLDTKEVVENAKTTVVPKYLPMFEKLLKDNGTDYLVGPTLTYADLQLYEVLIAIDEYLGTKMFEPYPKIKKFYEKLSDLSRIQYYKTNVRKRANDDAYVAEVSKVLARTFTKQ